MDVGGVICAKRCETRLLNECFESFSSFNEYYLKPTLGSDGSVLVKGLEQLNSAPVG